MNCPANSQEARLLYPTKLPHRPFAIEAAKGQKATSHSWFDMKEAAN